MKKAISVLLCIVMVIGVFCSTPMTVFAVETESPLDYYLNDDGTGYIVVSCDSEFQGDVVIPDEYEGLPVTAIDAYSFYYCYKIKSVTIPETVEIIGDGAFSNCYELTKIIVDENNQYFTTIDGVLYNKSVTELIAIPTAMTGGFVMPETLTQVKLNVSSGSKISSITINSKVEEIDVEQLKDHCRYLDEINVSSENQFFSSENGVLFNKDKTKLIFCPQFNIDDYTIPETVNKIGEYAFSYSNISSVTVGGNVKYIEQRAFWYADIKSIILEEGIESIDTYAFYKCENLTNVKIPSKVKYIGLIFAYCDNLEEVEIGDDIGEIGTMLFQDITSLKKLTLGNNYGKVSDIAFDGLEHVETLNIKDIESWISVSLTASANVFAHSANIYVDGKDITEITELTISKEIDFGANVPLLARLSSLTEFKIAEGAELECINYAVRDGVLYNSSLTDIIRYPIAKTGEYNVPETLRTISPHAFDSVLGLTRIEIPDEVVYLGEYMFANCINLESVVLSKNTTTIPFAAFLNCSSLKNIDLGDSLETIEKSAFSNSALTEITIPDTIKYVRQYAFFNNKNLETVRMGKGIEYVHEEAFFDCLIKDYYISSEVVTEKSVLGVNADKIHFIDGVKEISSKAFYYKKSIKEISISDTLETICSRAFADCKNLNTINFGTGLLEVGSEAFINCTSLQKVNIKKLHFWCNIRFSDSEANPLYYAQKLYVNDVLVEELEIPNGVIAVEDYAFVNCKSIKKIIIPESVKTLGTMAFCGVMLEQLYIPDIKNWCEVNIKNGSSLHIEEDETEVFVGGEKITELVIPEGIIKVPDNAFQGWYFLESVTFNDTVTQIGKNAFRNCINVKEISLPDSVKIIDEYAFANCFLLGTLNLGSGVEEIMSYAFAECMFIEKIVIPDSVTIVGNGVFDNCIYLKEVVLGDGLTYVPSEIFSNCVSIESLTIGKNIKCFADSLWSCSALKEIRAKDLTAWCEMEFSGSLEQVRLYINDKLVEGELIIPEGTERISSGAFSGYSLITSVTISNSVTEIGDYAFANCQNLEKVIFGSGVKTLSGNLFIDTIHLSEVVLSEGIERVEDNVFNGNRELTKIVLPKSLKYISGSAIDSNYVSREVYYNSDLIDWMNIEVDGAFGTPAFNGAKLYLNGELLENLVIPEEFTVIPEYAFSGIRSIKSVEMHDNIEIVSKNAFEYCSSIKSLKLSENLTEIGGFAFEGCSGLTSINLPETLTTIGDFAFSYCSGLIKAEIPDGVEVIPSRAFSNCKNLESIRLPNGLKVIGREAFYNCQKLGSIFIPKSVYSVGDYAFQKSGLICVYGEPDTMAVNIANKYNATFMDSTVLFAPVGENKQKGLHIITDSFMTTNVDELVKTLYFNYEVEILKLTGGEFVGTGSVIGVYDPTGNLVSEIVVVVKGDLNGDGVCDGLDCMVAELARTSWVTLEESYMLAGDYTEDDKIELVDFQQIVNKALDREVA